MLLGYESVTLNIDVMVYIAMFRTVTDGKERKLLLSCCQQLSGRISGSGRIVKLTIRYITPLAVGAATIGRAANGLQASPASSSQQRKRSLPSGGTATFSAQCRQRSSATLDTTFRPTFYWRYTYRLCIMHIGAWCTAAAECLTG